MIIVITFLLDQEVMIFLKLNRTLSSRDWRYFLLFLVLYFYNILHLFDTLETIACTIHMLSFYVIVLTQITTRWYIARWRKNRRAIITNFGWIWSVWIRSSNTKWFWRFKIDFILTFNLTFLRTFMWLLIAFLELWDVHYKILA